MITAQDLADAEATLALYEPDGDLLRLAELLSPASLIDPQLIRHMRLAHVRGASVRLEQELWFSQLVRARSDQGISLRTAACHLLRRRLRGRLATDRSVVEGARELMAEVHKDLSPVLVMGETLAWAEVFDDAVRLRNGADDLLDALSAGRDGLDYWLGRAWDGLPEALKETPAGRNLAQVAVMRGAEIEAPEASEVDISRVAHLLDRQPILLARNGSQLRFAVPPAEATHLAAIPDTAPLIVEVGVPGSGETAFQRIEIRPDTPAMEVGHGAVILRCIDGTEYRLEPIEHSTLFNLEMLPANEGLCLILTYGEPENLARVVVDTGPNKTVASELRARLEEAASASEIGSANVELLVVTHIDSDRIRGGLTLLAPDNDDLPLHDVWFNGPRHLPMTSETPP
ncbi:MAG: hypothetical protein AAF657_26090 [Acidobacteriota bacterium]